MRVDIGDAGEFEEGKLRIVEAAGRSIGVMRWKGEFLAARNRCPHMHAPICEGRVSPAMIGSSVGQVALDPDRPVIGCPWHGWQFDLRTGLAEWGERLRVQTFQVECRDGRLVIEMPDRRS
jgi:nitrite reductase (NADH) small subunit